MLHHLVDSLGLDLFAVQSRGTWSQAHIASGDLGVKQVRVGGDGFCRLQRLLRMICGQILSSISTT